MTFTIAIVGRPNVGKSTLFNRLVGKRLALVDDLPGVTRDRRHGEASLGKLKFNIIDTAGLEESTPDSLARRMLDQTKAALVEADAIFFLIDSRAGLLPADRAFADLVRKSGKPTIVLANKAEGKAGSAGALEAYALGLGEPVAISAEHGEGLADLHEVLAKLLPDQPGDEDDRAGIDSKDLDSKDRTIRVAIVGRPNAGKSTLINRLLGEDRMLTGPEAGITRDAIAVELRWRGKSFLVHDTAGLRKRARIDEKLEKLSVSDAINAVKFADVVVLLMDAAADFEEQDLRIADLVEREGRALVIGMNKWDLKETGRHAIGKVREEAAHWLPQVKGAAVVAVSGLTGEGLDKLMQAIVDAYAVWNKRVPTAALNRWFEEATSANPPPAASGRRLRLNYITQAKARPPSFIIFCTRADAVPEAYKRYLVNSLREAFDLPGTPIRLTLREKDNPYAKRK